MYTFMGNLDKEIKLSFQKAGDVILFENIRFFKEEEKMRKPSQKSLLILEMFL